jgi:hypothetical protein
MQEKKSAVEELQTEVLRQWNKSYKLTMTRKLWNLWNAAEREAGCVIPVTFGLELPEPPKRSLRISLAGLGACMSRMNS